MAVMESYLFCFTIDIQLSPQEMKMLVNLKNSDFYVK